MNFCKVNQFSINSTLFTFFLAVSSISNPLFAKTINSKKSLNCSPRVERTSGNLSPIGCGFKATVFEDASVSINYFGEVKEAGYNSMSATFTANFNNGSSCGLYKSTIDDTKWIGSCFVAKTDGYCSLECTPE